MTNIVNTSGKRKTAIARASISKGKGKIKINSVPVETYGTRLVRMKIKEVLVIASGYVNMDKIDIKVKVKGGGFMGQMDAIMSSIARGLVEWSKDEKLHNAYLEYDRTIIAGDHRQTEPHKPSQSRKGPRHKRQKSYR
ncbi:MAG: 30S ribosomal protein S9 [Candidatus Altiarchaeales archaeon ex4484_2]|nr:MAG: 30S ribosomal protein S9 [Candidatus Altiarchaeales archaeon ex4484_2]